jgi:hypothetical protein
LRWVMWTSGAFCDAPHHADGGEFNIGGCLGGKNFRVFVVRAV